MIVTAVAAACLTLAADVVAQEFHIEEVGYLTAESTAIFENGSNETKIECGEALYQGEMTATAMEQVQVYAQFRKCLIDAFQHVEILMNGCYFLWGAPAEAGKTGSVQIGCPTGQKIVFKTALCTAKMAPQTAGNGATYSNFGEGSSRDFVTSIDATEIDYDEISPATCSSIFGNGFNGRFTSSPTVAGFFTGAPGGTWVS